MKKQIIFIHGGNAYGVYGDFLKHLQTATIWDLHNVAAPKRWKETIYAEFGSTHEVFYPLMPNKQNAKFAEWKIWFERYFEHISGDVILIGHSLGGYFLTKYLSENKTPFPIAALYLVAAPFKNDNFCGEDGGDFSFDAAALTNLAQQVQNIVIAHSKDDTVVPFSHAEQFHVALPTAQCMTFEDRGHFLGEEFPEIIADLQKYL
jgi:predicted alpha/beta hydrolase family esterase